MNPKTKQTFIILGVGLALVVIGIFIGNRFLNNQLRQNGMGHFDSQENSEYSAPITVVPKMIRVTSSRYPDIVSGTYPEFPQADDAFNRTIANQIKTGVAAFEKSAADNQRVRMETGSSISTSDDGGYSYSVETTLVQSNEHYISFVVHIDGFEGGAHGYHVPISFNYDVKNRKDLHLSDFISLADASEQSRAVLEKQLADAANEKELDANARDMMMAGTDGDNRENWNVFTFTPNELIIYFSEYQVAPYAFGEQSVTIKR